MRTGCHTMISAAPFTKGRSQCMSPLLGRPQHQLQLPEQNPMTDICRISGFEPSNSCSAKSRNSSMPVPDVLVGVGSESIISCSPHRASETSLWHRLGVEPSNGGTHCVRFLQPRVATSASGAIVSFSDMTRGAGAMRCVARSRSVATPGGDAHKRRAPPQRPQKMMVASAQDVSATTRTTLQVLHEVRLLSAAHVRASVWSASAVLLAATLTTRKLP